RVRERVSARGRDIYGRRPATRQVLVLTAAVHRGDSGGPFVTADGQVGGVVFAAGTDVPRVGYALAGDRVLDDVARATARDRVVGTGTCRF
ncbi:MAG: trypsin-like serine protease, partial [Actinobacteria bacterium]|nr:trypsin-like serine protease [Actinomycetota bacterium]